MTSPYAIVLADNHARFRQELKRMVESLPGQKVVGEASNAAELFDLLAERPPQLVILDVSLPQIRVVEATLRIKASYRGVKVLVLIWERDPEYLIQAIAAGAAGCLVKQEVGSELHAALKTIRRGGVYLPVNFNEAVLRYFA